MRKTTGKKLSIEERMLILAGVNGVKELVAAYENHLKIPSEKNPLEGSQLREAVIEYVKLKKEKIKNDQSVFFKRTGHQTDQVKKTISGMGRLSGVTTINPHTREAVRLFEGRKREEKTVNGKPIVIVPIAGAKRVGSSLGHLSLMAGDNNPYADYFLILAEECLENVSHFLENETKLRESILNNESKKGVNIGVVESPNPASINLEFKSAYGYLVSRIVMSYDYLIRVLKTLQQVGIYSDDQVRNEIKNEINKYVLGQFMLVVNLEAKLNRENVKTFSRVDIVQQNELSVQLTKFLGEIPLDVLIGQKNPSHRAKKITISSQESELLSAAYEVVKSRVKS